jgi:hypothetical protein
MANDFPLIDDRVNTVAITGIGNCSGSDMKSNNPLFPFKDLEVRFFPQIAFHKQVYTSREELQAEYPSITVAV